VSLTAADVAEIMRLVEQSSFDELVLEIDGIKLCLRRGGGTASTYGNAAPTASFAPGGGAGAIAPTASPAPGGGGGSIASTASPGPMGSAGPPVTLTTSIPSPAPTSPIVTPAAADPTVHEVTSPLLGTFYRAPKPGAPPFVEVGSAVEENTVIAIVEVMKLMNTVRAGVRGTVTEILVGDGALVEYEQVLLRIRKSG
jgi:acetyl-CoA carboxylase biotin carboxyl carrier protein